MPPPINTGTDFTAPLVTGVMLGSQRAQVKGFSFRNNMRAMPHEFEDFIGTFPVYTLTQPFVRTNSSADLVQFGQASSVASAFFVVPRGGVVTAADFVSNSTLAANDTNFHTFTLTNLGSAGSGTTVLLATTPAGVNTTKATGGTAITAGVNYPLTLTGTAANLVVNTGDVLQLTATATATPANVVDAPMARLQIRTLPGDYVPRTVKTAGLPNVSVVNNTPNGEVICSLDATSEAQVAGIDFGNLLQLYHSRVAPNTNPLGMWFETFVKTSGVGANQRVVIGIATAFNSTFANITKYAWFKLSGNNNVTVEGVDGTNTTTALAPSRGTLTLTNNAYNLFRIDFSDLANVKFWLNDHFVNSLNMNALTTADVFQPVIYLQKDSGTGAPSLTIDHIGAFWPRF